MSPSGAEFIRQVKREIKEIDPSDVQPLVGNGVATVVVSRWEGELDRTQLHAALARPVTFGAR